MTDLELSYVNKYRKWIKLLAIIAMIVIIIMGCGLIGLGIYMIAVSDSSLPMIFIGVVIMLMGVSDIPLGIVFRARVKKNNNNMSDEEALKRYKRIYGIN